MREQAIRIVSQGLKLSAWLFLPEGGMRPPPLRPHRGTPRHIRPSQQGRLHVGVLVDGSGGRRAG